MADTLDTTDPAAPGTSQAAAASRLGILQAFAAYGIWGLFPLYFSALRPAGSWEILAHRILWAFVVCLVVLTIRRRWSWLRILARPKVGAAAVVAGFLIGANWLIYLYAVLSGATYQAALGYFLNPLVSVALGVVVLRERLRPLQTVAVGIGALAGIVLTVENGSVPWISLALAMSFGLYGLAKKRLGTRLDAMESLAAETVVLLPVAVGILVALALRGAGTFTGFGPTHTALLVLAGPVTAVPLLLFAASARRIPLTTIGLIQFVTPVAQLLIAVTVLGEHVTPGLWVGFGIVWVALAVLSYDAIRNSRRNSRARRGLPTAQVG